MHPPRRVAVPRAHHGSGSGRVMEKASEGFTREQRKAHGIRFGASPSRHRGGRAWFCARAAGWTGAGPWLAGHDRLEEKPHSPSANHHVCRDDGGPRLDARPSRRSRCERVGADAPAPDGGNARSTRLGALADGSSMRTDNMRIAGAAGSPGSRQIRYSSSPAHGLRLLRRSGSVFGGWWC